MLRRFSVALIGVVLAAASPLAVLRVHLDESGQVIQARSDVPRDRRPVGEVRLVRRRSGALVVETVLRTTLIGRAFGEIDRREERSWPPGKQGHRQSLRYRRALEAARNRLPVPPPRAPDRRRSVAIELILVRQPEPRAWVAVSAVEIEGADARGAIRAKDVLAWDVLDPTWVRADMIEILADVLRLPRSQARALVEQAAGGVLSPAGSPSPPSSPFPEAPAP